MTSTAKNLVTPEQLEAFHAKGYLAIRSIFTKEEVTAWDRESRRLLGLGLAHEDNLRTVIYKTPEGIPIVDRIHPVTDLSPLFKALTNDARIMNALRELYGEEMLLFKDKIVYKMPGVSGYAIHQDYSSWQNFPRNLVNVIVSVDRANAENGGVEFFPGYHQKLLSTAGELRQMNREEAAQIDSSKGELIETNPGDVVIFDCLTPHQSGVNRSNHLRRQLYLTYSSAKNGDLYAEQLEFFEATCRNRRSGEAKGRLFFR
jgi:hypothetical protein